jgi:oxygen-independent coproporphyrinogen-3 oxidase
MNLETLKNTYGTLFSDYCLQNAKKHLQQGRLLLENGQMRLSKKGLFVSNDIMSDLMWVD